MHPSTKISKPAVLALVFGLALMLQVSSGAPNSNAGAEQALMPVARAENLTLAPSTLSPATYSPSVLMSVQNSVCDRCRTICARSCSSYACYLCDRAPKCKYLVESCRAPVLWR